MKCIHLDHKEPSEFFKNYWEGIELLQKEMKDMYATVEANIECVKGHKISLECKVYKTAQIKKDLQDQASVLRNLLNETEEHIRNIESNYEGHDIIFDSYQKSIESCNNAVKLLKPDKIYDLNDKINVDCRGAVASVRDSYTDDPSSISVRLVVASW